MHSLWSEMVIKTIQQTSKGQTKMPRFRLEGTPPCKTYLLCAYTLCMNNVTKTFLFVNSSMRCTVEARKAKKPTRTKICRVS